MGSPRVKKLHHLALTQAASQSHAAPADATDGVSLETWKRGGYAPDAVAVALDGSTTIAISEGAYLAGYDATDEKWRKVVDLNDGEAIALTATVGYEERVIDVGAFDRLAVVTTGDTGTTTVTLTPIETLE